MKDKISLLDRVTLLDPASYDPFLAGTTNAYYKLRPTVRQDRRQCLISEPDRARLAPWSVLECTEVCPVKSQSTFLQGGGSRRNFALRNESATNHPGL
jgi:hypothetical protein